MSFLFPFLRIIILSPVCLTTLIFSSYVRKAIHGGPQMHVLFRREHEGLIFENI